MDLHTTKKAAPALALGLLLTSLSAANATTYVGVDKNASSDAGLVNSKAAQIAFDSAAAISGSVKTNGFESYPQSNVFSTGIVNSDFVITFSGSGEKANIVSAPLSSQSGALHFASNTLNGFDTDPGPATSHFVFVQPAGTIGKPGSVIITFAKPVDAFGLYVTGFGNIGPSKFLDVTLDGVDYGTDIHGSGTANKGGAEFFGITGAASFTQVVLTENGNKSGSDKFGIDDLSYVFSVPEPSTYALFGIGTLAILGMAFKARRNRSLQM